MDDIVVDGNSILMDKLGISGLYFDILQKGKISSINEDTTEFIKRMGKSLERSFILQTDKKQIYIDLAERESMLEYEIAESQWKAVPIILPNFKNNMYKIIRKILDKSKHIEIEDPGFSVIEKNKTVFKVRDSKRNTKIPTGTVCETLSKNLKTNKSRIKEIIELHDLNNNELKLKINDLCVIYEYFLRNTQKEAYPRPFISRYYVESRKMI